MSAATQQLSMIAGSGSERGHIPADFVKPLSSLLDVEPAVGSPPIPDAEPDEGLGDEELDGLFGLGEEPTNVTQMPDTPAPQPQPSVPATAPVPATVPVQSPPPVVEGPADKWYKVLMRNDMKLSVKTNIGSLDFPILDCKEDYDMLTVVCREDFSFRPQIGVTIELSVGDTDPHRLVYGGQFRIEELGLLFLSFIKVE